MSTTFRRMQRSLLDSGFQAWLLGIGSAFDLSGGAEDLLDRERSDWANLGNDWKAVGRDMEYALNQAEAETQKAEIDQLSLAL